MPQVLDAYVVCAECLVLSAFSLCGEQPAVGAEDGARLAACCSGANPDIRLTIS
jgi:hypothetical protein